ncbi:unnamed protein product [Peniophora sp. CBMAI 1063]|nr:unnamed protein product [Peniophora sp. CBMAI 1063]
MPHSIVNEANTTRAAPVTDPDEALGEAYKRAGRREAKNAAQVDRLPDTDLSWSILDVAKGKLLQRTFNNSLKLINIRVSIALRQKREHPWYPVVRELLRLAERCCELFDPRLEFRIDSQGALYAEEIVKLEDVAQSEYFASAASGSGSHGRSRKTRVLASETKWLRENIQDNRYFNIQNNEPGVDHTGLRTSRRLAAQAIDNARALPDRGATGARASNAPLGATRAAPVQEAPGGQPLDAPVSAAQAEATRAAPGAQPSDRPASEPAITLSAIDIGRAIRKIHRYADFRFLGVLFAAGLALELPLCVVEVKAFTEIGLDQHCNDAKKHATNAIRSSMNQIIQQVQLVFEENHNLKIVWAIGVCGTWFRFLKFTREKTPKFQFGRVDGKGHYTPSHAETRTVHQIPVSRSPMINLFKDHRRREYSSELLMCFQQMLATAVLQVKHLNLSPPLGNTSEDDNVDDDMDIKVEEHDVSHIPKADV